MPYTIAKGDTLSGIAAKNNTTVDALMAANSNNSAVKNKNLIIQGGSLNIPEVTSSNQSATAPTTPGSTAPVTPQTPAIAPAPVTPVTPVTPTGGTGSQTGSGAPGAVSPQSVPSDDWSAGFATFATEMAGIGSSVDTLNQDYMQASGAIQNPDGTWNYNPTPEEVAEHQSNLQSIKDNATTGRSDVQAAAATATLQAKKSQELLGMGPAAVKYNIDLFNDQNTQLFKSISDAFSKIEEDQNTATINEDYQYASQLQQEKLSLLGVQRQALQDKSSFMTNAFNMMLGGKQEERLTADDAITKVQNTYALGQVPTASDWSAAGFAGNPPTALNLQTWSPPYMLDGKLMQQNKQTGELKTLSVPYYDTLDPGTQQSYIDSWVADVTATPADISKISDPTLRNEVQLQIQNQIKAQQAADASSSAQPNWLQQIWGDLTNSNPTAVNPTSTTSSDFTGGIATSSLQGLGSQLDSITPPPANQ